MSAGGQTDWSAPIRRSRLIYPAILLAVLVIAAGLLVQGASAVGMSGEPIYMLCYQRGEGTIAKQHPRNCISGASLITQHSDAFLLFDFRKLRWKNWGSADAKATGFSVNRETYTWTKVRFAVSGVESCEGKSFYLMQLIESPRRFNPHHLTARLPPLFCPTDRRKWLERRRT